MRFRRDDLRDCALDGVLFDAAEHLLRGIRILPRDAAELLVDHAARPVDNRLRNERADRRVRQLLPDGAELRDGLAERLAFLRVTRCFANDSLSAAHARGA